MKLLHIIFLISLSIVLLTGCQSKKDQPTPNLIILLADDLGYNDLSCFRENHDFESDAPPTCRTPVLDQLAREGMRFTNFYAGAAVCSPSRSALITGRNATRVGIYNWIPPDQPMHLRASEITIAEMLKASGYSTGHFGKWHLTSEGMGQPLPNDQGFETSFFSYNNANPSHKNPENYFRNGEPVGPTEGFACQIVMDEALEWLEQQETKEHPFFLNIWFNEPHRVTAAPKEFADHHTYEEQYYGCIENMDMAVGRLFQFLEEHNMEENTMVLFLSDNGSDHPNSNLPLRGRKALNFEGGIRTPMIAKYPGVIPKGTVSSIPASFTDIFPTIASLTGSDIPRDRIIDGVDITSVLLGGEINPVRETPLFFYRYFHDPVIMLREGDWVLLGYVEPLQWQKNYEVRDLAKIKPGPDQASWEEWRFKENHMAYLKAQEITHFELFNVAEDISQKTDLSAQYPERSEEMKIRALTLKKEMVDEGGDWYSQ